MAQESRTGTVDLKAVNTPYEDYAKQLGELLLAIRLDSSPAAEAARLTAEGKYYPLTVDANGFLRVTLPEGTKVVVGMPELLEEMRDLLSEMRDLLLKIA